MSMQTFKCLRNTSYPTTNRISDKYLSPIKGEYSTNKASKLSRHLEIIFSILEVIPGTSDETPHHQDLCQSHQKLPKEHHQTSHLCCARILFDHENRDLMLLPACKHTKLLTESMEKVQYLFKNGLHKIKEDGKKNSTQQSFVSIDRNL